MRWGWTSHGNHTARKYGLHAQQAHLGYGILACSTCWLTVQWQYLHSVHSMGWGNIYNGDLRSITAVFISLWKIKSWKVACRSLPGKDPGGRVYAESAVLVWLVRLASFLLRLLHDVVAIPHSSESSGEAVYLYGRSHYLFYSQEAVQ